MAKNPNDLPFGNSPKRQNIVDGNNVAVSLWPDPYGRAPITNESDSTADAQAQYARDERAKKPAEKALCSAIVAERGYGQSKHPRKEAESVVDNVNGRLAQSNVSPVSVHTVYRRLKNWRVLQERT